MKNKTSFTIMEIMVTIVILALITAFAVPQYQKAIQKVRERDAAAQLLSIHTANSLYLSQTKSYFPGSGNLDYINNGLGLRIMANGLVYSYSGPTAAMTFTATARWVNVSSNVVFSLRVNELPVSPTNPCCNGGTCLLYQGCVP